MKPKIDSVLIIVNPKAGREEAPASAGALAGIFEDMGSRVRILHTGARGDARRMARDQGDQVDLLIACGGDGTLSEVISGLMALSAPPELGFLPVGSTCDVARTFQLSSDPVRAAKDIVEGIAYPIDIGRIGGSSALLRQDLPPEAITHDPDLLPDHFSYVASFGAFAETSYATRRKLKKALGHFAYILTGLQSVTSIHPVPCQAILDGVDYSGDYIFGGVLNSFSVGGMVKLDDVLFNDGFFEVLLVKPPRNIGQTARLIALLLRRKTGDTIIRQRAREISFSFDDPVSFTVDGEYGGSRSQWTIHNLPRAIRLRIPKAPGSSPGRGG